MAPDDLPRVLVVEDDHFGRDMLCIMLRDKYEVISVAKIGQALTVLRGDYVDVALLDFYLLGETSRVVADLADQIGIPIVWMTGDPGFFDSAHVILVKPFNYRQVLNALATARNRSTA